jgi:hypothetical protein
MRKIDLGKNLYDRFYEICFEKSRIMVSSCTAPINKLSIKFHQAMGFSIEPGDSAIDGVPATRGYLWEDDQKVLFKKILSNVIRDLFLPQNQDFKIPHI